jgi:N-acetylglucosamine-6-phosphate deacetylase
VNEFRIANAMLVLPDRVIPGGAVHVRDGVIAALGPGEAMPGGNGSTIDAGGQFLAPGYIDMHVHGGGGADFMDGTVAAFETAVAAHTRHGTTSIVPTSTVARHEQTLAFLSACREMKRRGPDPARGLGRVIGAHLYGPYFAEEKVGCHPHEARPPRADEYTHYLTFADTLLTATCAPELPGAADFYRAARAAGVRLNAGHSNATWVEMRAAYDLGVRHVDHLFCAMSNYVSLRSRFPVPREPMQAGICEFVLATADVTTELIADGRHLSPELMRFALVMKGPDRVALVTDCSRALDQPPGEYQFGPTDGGEPFYSDGTVGLTPDRAGLASGVRGMDFMVRHLHQSVGIDLPTAIRMATLTPATILGVESDLGSIEVGKRADLLLLDGDLNVRQVWVGGEAMHPIA